MIRIAASTEGTETPGFTLDEINAALDDWVSKASEWSADPEEHVMNLVDDPIDDGGTVYFGGTYRFTLDDAKDNLIQKLEDKLKTKVDWYRIGYHVCDHDETDRDGCAWEDAVEYTAKNVSGIPSDVPDFS